MPETKVQKRRRILKKLKKHATVDIDTLLVTSAAEWKDAVMLTFNISPSIWNACKLGG